MMNLRRMRWVGHVARMGNAYMILVGEPEGMKPLEDRRRCEDNIKMGLREMGLRGFI
jgi:hypothetical protein